MKNIKEERFVNVVLSFHYQQQLSWGYHACNTKLLLVSHSLIPRLISSFHPRKSLGTRLCFTCAFTIQFKVVVKVHEYLLSFLAYIVEKALYVHYSITWIFNDLNCPTLIVDSRYLQNIFVWFTYHMVYALVRPV